MSVESEILRIQHNIADAYAAVDSKGGTVPMQPISANLAASVASIPAISDLTAGDGIDISGNTIRVTTPVKGVTQAEYNALPEEQKQTETVYLVDDPPWLPVSLSIQEYDTDNGWHVRKWSDGYVEMEYSAEVDWTIQDKVVDGTPNGNIMRSPVKAAYVEFPFPLIQKYSENLVFINGSGETQMCWAACKNSGTLTSTGWWFVIHLNDNNPSVPAVAIRVNGRWK